MYINHTVNFNNLLPINVFQFQTGRGGCRCMRLLRLPHVQDNKNYDYASSYSRFVHLHLVPPIITISEMLYFMEEKQGNCRRSTQGKWIVALYLPVSEVLVVIASSFGIACEHVLLLFLLKL